MCSDVTHVKRQVQNVQFKQLKHEILLFACTEIPRLGLYVTPFKKIYLENSISTISSLR